MDRLYLRISVAMDMWRHEDQLETFLFEELASEENLLETRELISVINKAAIEMENYCLKQNQDLYSQAEKLYRTKDLTSFWEHSHKIIKSSAIDAPELRKILLLRAKIFNEYGFTQSAIQDYEICVYIAEQNNVLYLEELSCLIECYYCTGEFEKFEECLTVFRKQYNKELKLARNKRMQKKNSSRLTSIKQYEDIIKRFEHLRENLENKLHSTYLGEANDERGYIPYQGFKGNLDERISSASVACTWISSRSSTERCSKIVANRRIPLGEIIAFERPLDREYYTPILQCEHCFQLTTILYTCFHCHHKCFCQLQCLKDDWDIHQYECAGLRNALLYSMEATMLFRLFIKSLSYIKTHIFCKYRKASDIHDFFELVMDNIKYGPQAKIKKLLTTFDNYETIDYNEIYSMATYALRIAVYAVEKTSILEDFFIDVQFGEHDILVFAASLLLRLQNQIKINSVECGYTIVHPENLLNVEVKPYESEIFYPNFKRKNDFQTIFDYCNYTKEEALSEAKQLISTYVNATKYEGYATRYKEIRLPVKVTRKFMNQCYLDNLGDAEHEFTLEEKLNIAFRSTKEILHLRVHTFNSNLSDGTSAVTMQAAYPTITRFNHSCQSNAVPILLESGSLIIKAGKEILRGEEITISYMAEYKCHPNPVRKQLQDYLKINCNCKFCTSDDDYWEQNNAVYCYKCSNIIINSKCSVCGIPKLKVCAVYDEICKSVRNTAAKSIEDQNEIKTMKYLILFYQIHTLMFSESHHSSFISKLELGLSCVQKNFVYDSFKLLRNFYYQIPVVLGEWNFQYLIYLSMILDKLLCLLNGNISHNKNFVKLNFGLFYDIWILANEIASKLIYHHDFLEIFNFTTHNILTSHQLLIQLKFMLFELEYGNLVKPAVDADDAYELPKLGSDVEEELTVSSSAESYDTQCHLGIDFEEISFFVKKEDLVSIPSISKFVSKDEFQTKDYNFNFINPDMTGNDNTIEEADLKIMIENNDNNIILKNIEP